MSLQSLISQISSVDREINSLQKQIQRYDSRISSKQKEAQRILDKISKEKDLKKIVRYQKDLTRKNDEITTIEKQKSSKTDQLSKKQKRKFYLSGQLRKEDNRETEIAKREQKELLFIQREVTSEMEKQKRLTKISENEIISEEETNESYDVFISHASEDKEEVAKPLAELLLKKEVKVWLDEFELKIGDSLRRKIDHGLSNSRYGIVILSESFFKKEWPQKELDGLVAKESDGQKVVLPIWHKVSKNEVMKFSPTLADKKALNTSSFTLEEIADQISQLFE